MKNPAPRLAVLGAGAKGSARFPSAAQRRVCTFSFASSAAKVLACSLFAIEILLFVVASAGAQTQIPPRNESERELFELLNRDRVANHLPELKWDDALFKAARKHALLMLDLNIMEHQLPGEPGLEERLTNAGARFTYIAENIASGRDSASIHNGWMDSPGHRANILSPRATAVGIAVVRGTSGLFAVQDFSRAFENESLEQQEKQVASLLAAEGLHVTGAPDDARASCDGSVHLPHSGALIRFETGSLSEIPPELKKKLHHEPFQNVSVGACRTPEAAGFARYKIALLFF